MADLGDQMGSLLFRMHCPDSTELGEYQLGMLDPQRSAQIRSHLAECTRCTDELAMLKSYLSELAPDIEMSPIERLKIWIAERLPATPGMGLSLSPGLAQAGLRGEGGMQLHYHAGGTYLTLEVQADPSQSGQRSLVGLLMDVDMRDLQASLWQAGKQVAVVEVDELGNFVFNALDPGLYELIVQGTDVEIHIPEFII